VIRFALTAAVLALATAPVFAQDAAPSAEETPPAATAPPEEAPDRIVVTGERDAREKVEVFIGEVRPEISSNFGYALWDRRVCIGVENIPVAPAQYIVDRISQVAGVVGLKPGRPGCTPNVYIVFAADGRALASYLVEEQPRFFRPFGGVGGTTQGLDALEEFASSDAPVRWWQISMPVDRLGRPALDLPETQAISGGPPVVAGANSLITNSVHDALWATYVIVDAGKLEGANWAQLADYLAMVALSQVDPGASVAGHDSILNLFGETNRPDGLTDWDWIYLRSLYDLDRHLMPRMQEGALVNLMMRNQERSGED
jgi:hypothetical protein